MKHFIEFILKTKIEFKMNKKCTICINAQSDAHLERRKAIREGKYNAEPFNALIENRSA